MAMNNIAVKKVIQKLQPEEITTFLWDDNSVLHRHSDWEFTSTVDGTGCNVVNGTPYDLMPGDFVLLGPQHVHQYVSDKPIQRRDVCIATEKMQQLCFILSPDLYEKLCKAEKPIIIHLSLETFGELHQRLNKLSALESANLYSSATLVSIVVYLLGVYVEHKSEKKHAGKHSFVSAADFQPGRFFDAD